MSPIEKVFLKKISYVQKVQKPSNSTYSKNEQSHFKVFYGYSCVLKLFEQL